ncbi:GNAT family N-acetyltransferase [Subtercola boreus]|uniref:GNAT family N-acetyltransferase n=1 Tax=Subtercola boreus TaxID=120213 RepID=UPI002482E648|nr:GNAT family protein [Subtercola boreus]
MPSPADAGAWHRLFDDAEVMRFIGDGRVRSPEWYQEFAARQRLLAADTGLCLFALVRVDDRGDGEARADTPASGAGHAAAAGLGTVAGFVGIQPWTQPWGPTGRPEIGWRLGVEHQGLGLATAAARECLARAAATGIQNPVAMIDVRNIASIAVARKLGMQSLDEIDAPTGARVAVYGFGGPDRTVSG